MNQPKESKSKIQPNKAMEFSTEELLTATVATLKEQNSALEEARKRAEKRLQDEWLLPKRITTVIAFLAGSFALFTFWQQYVVISELRQRSERLDTLLTEAKDSVLVAQASVRENNETFQNEFSQIAEQSRESINTINESAKSGLKSELDEFRSQMESDQASAFAEIEVAHRVLSIVSMGREQVFLKHNPSRALIFADAAKNVFESFVQDSQNIGTLDSVRPVIWNLRFECLLQTLEWDRLRSESTSVIAEHPDSCITDPKFCILKPAYYYRSLTGINQLAQVKKGIHKNILKSEDFEKRYTDLLSQTIDDLQKGTGAEADDSVCSLFSSLLFVARGEYGKARTALSQLLEKDPAINYREFAETESNRKLASEIHNLILYMIGELDAFPIQGCSGERSTITRWNAGLMEDLLSAIIQNREWHTSTRLAEHNENPIDEQEKPRDFGNELGLRCVDFILELRALSGCGAIDSSIVPPTIRMYGLASSVTPLFKEHKGYVIHDHQQLGHYGLAKALTPFAAPVPGIAPDAGNNEGAANSEPESVAETPSDSSNSQEDARYDDAAPEATILSGPITVTNGIEIIEQARERDDLLAEFELKNDFHGISFSFDKSLGRVIDGKLWMKRVQIEYKEQEASREYVVSEEDGREKTETRVIRVVKPYLREYFVPLEETNAGIPGGSYVRVMNEDLDDIRKISRQVLNAN